VKPKKKNKHLPVVPEHIGSTTNLHPRLSALVVYTQPAKFDTFEEAKQRDLHYNMSSFAETKALNMLKENACELVDYTQRHLTRIYPKDTRADSSNYMPQVFWNAGCQMVALNFQTPDLPMQLNQGMFEYNGNCGYILKPEFMRRKDAVFNPFSYGPIDGIVAVTCTVRVLSGAFLTDQKVGTFVEVDLFGLPTDTIRKEFRTRTIPSNGLYPHYNEDPFIFNQVLVPDLAMLRFGVYDEFENCLGQRILPLDGLQSGYRHISLRTEGSIALSQPSLFCEINISILIPDELQAFALSLTDPTAVQRLAKTQREKLAALGIEMATAAESNNETPDDDELKFAEITVDTLLLEKSFEKFAKRNRKELDAIAKKQIKERGGLQKAHFARIAKFLRGKSKKDAKTNPDFGVAVQSQNDEWREVIGRHRKERWDILKKQLLDQEEVMKKIMTGIHIGNEKQLKEKHLQEMKDLNLTQIKKNAEICKEVETDKSLKKKARSKRLREHKKSCRVQFADEKTDLAEKQGVERDELKVAHQKQLENFENEVKLVRFQ
jgi:phosphatidylinositol phospholipase C, beta